MNESLNRTLIQYFHAQTPKDGGFWRHLNKEAAALRRLGITAAWLPPAFKGDTGVESLGYDLYDRYDLGDYPQKNTIRTRYGTRTEYLEAIRSCQSQGIDVYVDTVFNTLCGGDDKESVLVFKKQSTGDPKADQQSFRTDLFTKFLYRARKDEHSGFTWGQDHFKSISAKLNGESNSLSLLNENDPENPVAPHTSADYSSWRVNKLDLSNPEVQEELKKWAEWYYQLTKFDGVHLEDCENSDAAFLNDWLNFVHENLKPGVFAMGSLWVQDKLKLLLDFIEKTEGKVSVFDSVLQHRFHLASMQPHNFNMQTILRDTLTATLPKLSVTIVSNLQTQSFQPNNARIKTWFRPLAYSIILLRREGYPCVFYPDLYGAHYLLKTGSDGDQVISEPRTAHLFELLTARKEYAFGEQHDYFDDQHCIGWTRSGIPSRPASGCAVLMSTGRGSTKKMLIGKNFAGVLFRDLLGTVPDEVAIDKEGYGQFACPDGGVCVWVRKSW